MIASIRNRVKKIETIGRGKREPQGHFILAHSAEDLEQQKAKYRAVHGDEPDILFIMSMHSGDTHENPCEPN